MHRRVRDLLALAIVTFALCYVFSVLLFSVSEIASSRGSRLSPPATPVAPQQARGVVVLPTE